MALNEQLINRVREALMHLPAVEEKKIFGGLCFMVDDKMCVSVTKNDELMLRIDPAISDELLERNAVRPMIHRGIAMKGYLYVAPDGYKTKKDFEYWINLAVDYNKRAKSSKKKKK